MPSGRRELSIAMLVLVSSLSADDAPPPVAWPARHPTEPFVFPGPQEIRAPAPTPTPAPVPERVDPLGDIELPKAGFLMPGRASDDIRRHRQPLAEDVGGTDSSEPAAHLAITNEFRDLATKIVATPAEGEPLVLLLPPEQSDAFDLDPGPWTFRRELWRLATSDAVPVIEEFPEQNIEPKRRYKILLDDSAEGPLLKLADSPVRN